MPRLIDLRYVRERELLTVLPFGKTHLWAMVKSGGFPKPIKLSPRVTAWKEHEVLAWLQSRESDGTGDGMLISDAAKQSNNHQLAA